MILYIANRGEIALRILRTAKRMGFKVAVGFANQDEALPFVEEADIRLPLEGREAKDTYLHFEKVLDAARKAKAQYLHPGYGFLAESSQFANLLELEGIEFVGPSPESMRLLGDKIGSRHFLKNLNVPLLPSYEDKDQSLPALKKAAEEIGFPILIKPSAGGGGKGMLRVDQIDEFESALSSSKRIAKSAFGDDRVFLEKFLDPARHIEVQIAADKRKNIIVLGERECSLQRKHQKLIEETPCVFLSPKLREKIWALSQTIANEASYFSLGTVEWIWNGKDEIYFLEVNTRLQVEHPVTEMVWNLDLVELQLKVAMSETLEKIPLQPEGHSMEARICAEDPTQDFLPSGGKIHRLELPTGLRNDFGYREKNEIPSEFDSLIGKVIAHGDNRNEALQKLKTGLEQLVLFGPTTNRAFLVRVLSDLRVQSGELATNLIQSIDLGFDVKSGLSLVKDLKAGNFVGSSLATLENEEIEDLDYYSPWGPVRLAQSRGSSVHFEEFGGQKYFHTAFADWTTERNRNKSSDTRHAAGLSGLETSFDESVKSPMPAKIIKVNVRKNDKVRKGQVLLILEAMKMEHQIKAPREGVIEDVLTKEGEQVPIEAELIRFAKKNESP